MEKAKALKLIEEIEEGLNQNYEFDHNQDMNKVNKAEEALRTLKEFIEYE